jgi:putative RNA 2'-phosphotransferase
MPQDPIVATSKLLSYVLRHRPDSIGLALDAHGWAAVDELLARLAASGKPVDRALLERVVALNDKQRFAFNEDRTQIRASQGHSIAVDLQLQEAEPPAVLYHGTASRFLKSILAAGLRACGLAHAITFTCRPTCRLPCGSARGMASRRCWWSMRRACGRTASCFINPTTASG